MMRPAEAQTGGEETTDMPTTLKVRQNGSLLVDGDDVTLIDWNGNPYDIVKRPFALCRCGASTKKPFCDGTHSRIGFQAAEAAVPGSVERPAGTAQS
jgi:CDGSH-type Zn-finger protein